MKILILGGTGLTGPFTTRFLREQGHQVTIFHGGQHQVDLPPEVNRIIGERHKLDEFISEFQQWAPDVVLDMLAFTRQDAEMLMRVFKGIAKRVVVPSSIDVYRVFGRLHGTEPGSVESIPLAEEAPLREKLSIHKPLVQDEAIIAFGYRDTQEQRERGSQDVRAAGINTFELERIHALGSATAAQKALKSSKEIKSVGSGSIWMLMCWIMRLCQRWIIVYRVVCNGRS